MFTTSATIVEFFENRELHDEAHRYIVAHAKRYAFLIEQVLHVRQMFPRRGTLAILDIGPSFFTELLRHALPQDSIFTLGFDAPQNRGGHFPLSVSHDKTTHFAFDLNDALHQSHWIHGPEASLVIMAEVIEHLYTSPKQVLRFVWSLMTPGGCLLIQTPNAAALKKRLKLLRGVNPYEMIRDNRDNPGHFREYTRKELTTLAKTAGFEVMAVQLTNYHSHDSSKSAVGRIVRAGLTYPNFCRGITITVKKPLAPETPPGSGMQG